MATGTAVIDFGSTPTDEATVTVTGQTGLLAGDHIEAFVMLEATASNGVDEHEELATMTKPVCGSIVAGASFGIKLTIWHALAIGTFNLRWASAS